MREMRTQDSVKTNMSAKIAERLGRAVPHRLEAAGFNDWLDFASASSELSDRPHQNDASEHCEQGRSCSGRSDQ